MWHLSVRLFRRISLRLSQNYDILATKRCMRETWNLRKESRGQLLFDANQGRDDPSNASRVRSPEQIEEETINRGIQAHARHQSYIDVAKWWHAYNLGIRHIHSSLVSHLMWIHRAQTHGSDRRTIQCDHHRSNREKQTNKGKGEKVRLQLSRIESNQIKSERVAQLDDAV